MIWTVYRVDRSAVGEEKTVIGCTGDFREIGVIILEDRDKIDWEPSGYDVIEEGD